MIRLTILDNSNFKTNFTLFCNKRSSVYAHDFADIIRSIAVMIASIFEEVAENVTLEKAGMVVVG